MLDFVSQGLGTMSSGNEKEVQKRELNCNFTLKVTLVDVLKAM